VSWHGFSALRQLTFLEEFILHQGIARRNKDAVSLLNCCHCHNCTSPASNIEPVPFINISLWRLAELSSEALREITRPHTLQLRHLALITLIGIPEYVALPEVQVLYLRAPSDETPLFPGRFPKLSESTRGRNRQRKSDASGGTRRRTAAKDAAGQFLLPPSYSAAGGFAGCVSHPDRIEHQRRTRLQCTVGLRLDSLQQL